MTDFGSNTDTTGGTRFSEGKVVLTWLPWRGIWRAWRYADDADPGFLEYAKSTRRDPLEWLRAADLRLAHAMNAGPSFAHNLEGCLYWLLQLCHHVELDRGSDRDPAGSEAVFFFRYPALGVWEVGRVSCYGAEKYAPFDWDEGQAFSTLLSSARRHVDKALAFGPFSVDSWHGDEPEGTEYSGLLHVAHAAWNVACLLDFLEHGRREELDDVSVWHGITTARKRELLDDDNYHADRPDGPDWMAVRDRRDGA